MQTPLELAFKDVEPSDEIKALVAEKTALLETYFDGITSCHVYIRAPHGGQRTGGLYQVTIEVRVPGDELVVRHHQNDVAKHEHLRVAVRDAFAAMAEKLKNWKNRIRGNVKVHHGPLQGKIVEISPDEDYGKIIANDHRLVYFHRNSVVGADFEALQVLDAVELVVQEDESAIGPQASTVRPISNLAYDPATRQARR